MIGTRKLSQSKGPRGNSNNRQKDSYMQSLEAQYRVKKDANKNLEDRVINRRL